MFKRLFLLTIAVVLLAACKSEPRTGEFTIEMNRASVKVTVANGKWVPSVEHKDGLDDVERGLWLSVDQYDSNMGDFRFDQNAVNYPGVVGGSQMFNDKRYVIIEDKDHLGKDFVRIWMMFSDNQSFLVNFGSSDDEDLKPYYDEFVTIVSTMSLK